MSAKNNFSHSATIFPVADLQKSLDFYTDKLDFKLTFSWGEPTDYAVLKNGGVSIHLTKRLDKFIPSKSHCSLYIFVHDLNTIYERCKRKEVQIINSPKTQEYKIRDFDIIDPDGYIITFGNGE